MNFKNQIVYQIWPRSFKDSDGDGIGDLRGILSTLDYIKSLGVDLIWLSPIYLTENKDYGYDVADYYEINPEYGTMEDFDELLEEAKKRDMGILMDLVANHTSDKHPWFREALKGKSSPYRDYYFFKEGRIDAKGNLIPPNNWLSAFGGEAWQKDSLSYEYYLTTFTPNQVDLNWDNENVRQGIYDIMDFWLKKGIAGFRMDVINTISKTEGLPSIGTSEKLQFPFEHVVSLPKSHTYLQEMHEKVLSKYPDAFTVGEGMVTSKADLISYTHPDQKKLQMMFHFDLHLIGCGPLGKFDFRKFYFYTPKQLKDTIFDWQETVEEGGGWLGNFLSNHDQPRQVSRFLDDGVFRVKSAKALVLLNLTLRGTPFLYQGEEIGMTNLKLEKEDWRDYEAINDYQVLQDMMHIPKPLATKIIQKMTRDNARTPMQWSNEEYGGFSTVDPWIKVNPNYKTINVEEQELRSNSILNFYREAISVRKSSQALNDGSFIPVRRDHSHVLSYLRVSPEETYLFVMNLKEKKVKFNFYDEVPGNYTPIIGSYGLKSFSNTLVLNPYEAILFKQDR